MFRAEINRNLKCSFLLVKIPQKSGGEVPHRFINKATPARKATPALKKEAVEMKITLHIKKRIKEKN